MERRDARVETLEHAVCGERVLLLLRSLELYVGDTRGEVLLVKRIALALRELHILVELRLFVREPLADLLAAEGELACTVSEVEAGQRTLDRDGASDDERTRTGRGDRATSLVTVK